jgi:hypothetical protein
MFSMIGTYSVHGRYSSGAPPALGAPQSRNAVSAAPNPLFYLPGVPLAGMGLGFAREKPYTAAGATASASFLLA